MVVCDLGWKCVDDGCVGLFSAVFSLSASFLCVFICASWVWSDLIFSEEKKESIYFSLAFIVGGLAGGLWKIHDDICIYICCCGCLLLLLLFVRPNIDSIQPNPLLI